MLRILQNICRCGNKNILLRLFILLLATTNVVAQVESETVDIVSNGLSAENIIEQARRQKLAEDPAWLNLLHYKKGIFGSQQSQADDKAFFISADGANNAWFELEADLKGFFEAQTIQVGAKEGPQHPQCRFPARLHWLNSKLDFAKQLVKVNCDKYEVWKEKHKAQQITLLFPSMHLSNPASMFGHTFLRFDTSEDNHLLSKTLSYAAAVDKTDMPLVYAWKGIMGGYNGQFYLKAYFETLQEYSDIEQRDIWEYQLNLTQVEVQQLLRHLWEIQGIKFDYYFLRENCAFRLLALLDVARENINMSLNSHPIYAVPVDIVRDVEQAGLIGNRFYRPATHNKISQMADQLGSEESLSALKLSSNEQSIKKVQKKFTEKQQAKIFQLADELIGQKKNITESEQKLQLEILSALSKLSVTTDGASFEYKSEPPELSHDSARWQISAGEQERQRFYEIGIRPVFHDLLDARQGFNKGAAISVLDTRLRWYKEEEKLEFEKIKLFSMRSLVPVKPWVTPVSRQILFQIRKREISESEEITEFESQFDIGYSTEFGSALVYLMAKAQLEYATELEDNHGFQLGTEAGLVWDFNNSLLSGQTEFKYQALQQVSGQETDIQLARAGIQINIMKDHALRFEYEYTEYETFELSEGKLSYLVYF